MVQADTLLRFIRTYGHDFLNHLQVISGYAQLQKTEQIREYIGRVTDEILAVGRVARLSAPEAAAGLLFLRECAARYGVSLAFSIEGDLPPGPGAAALRQGLMCLGDVFPPLEGNTAPVVLTVAGGAEPGVILALPVDRAVLGEEVDRSFEEARRRLAEAGGRVEIQETHGGVRIVLVIPAAAQAPAGTGGMAAGGPANATGEGR